MTADLIPAQCQAISLAGLAASMATNLALAEGEEHGVYRRASLNDLKQAQAALDIIAAALATEQREAA